MRRFATATGMALALAGAGPAAGAVTWREASSQSAAWYAGAEARAIADAVLAYQTPSGGWPKNHDMTRPPAPAEFTEADVTAPTLDNGATHTQIRFLARVATAQPDVRSEAAVARGIDYLLAAQYPNGGWPQFYPLRPGYSVHITFNDGAMIGALTVLRGVARGRAPYAFVDAERRARAAEAVARGIACILRCQIVVDGARTAWCAQHDEITFEPVPARAYEHESLSGLESVGIVRFLMGEPRPSPEIVAAIRAAVAWFERAKLTGLRVEDIPAPALPHGRDRRVVSDPQAPPLWARFYEIGTNRPMFGGRDTVIRHALAEVEPERRSGYRWYTDEPAELLARDYPAWAAKWQGSAR